MSVEVRDPRMSTVVDSQVEMERVAGEFEFTEGPVWNREEQHLIFSDMPADRMRRWQPAGGVSDFRAPSNMANGNAYDNNGRLVTCEHATSRVSRTEHDGTISILAERYRGLSLNSPNDIVVAPDGGVYFTDPTFGRMPYIGIERDPELDFQGVYRVSPDGELELLVDDFVQPNGLCFSLDQRRMFINDSDRGHIRAFTIERDGGLGDGTVWASLEGEGDGVADGLKTDSHGNVYCCGPGGIHVFADDAAYLGVLHTPEVSANFTWGDADLKTMYVCASSSLYRLPMNVSRLPSYRAEKQTT